MTISQQAFVENTASTFDVSSGRIISLSTGLKLEEFDENALVVGWPFHELVGCLLWLANQTRPDTAKALKAVATFANQRREVHWRTAVGTLEYEFSTSDSCNTLQKGSGLELVAFADADYASKAAERRSVSGVL